MKQRANIFRPESRIMLPLPHSAGDAANWSTNNRRQLNGRPAPDQFSAPRICSNTWDRDPKSVTGLLVGSRQSALVSGKKVDPQYLVVFIYY